MADLKTDYKDDVLDTSVNSKRTFNIVDQDGNIIFENVTLNDTTAYSQIGDSFGALDINSTNEAIEQVSSNLETHTHDGRYYTETEIDTKFKQVNSDLGKKQDASTAINTSNIGNQAVSKATYDNGGYHIHNTFDQIMNYIGKTGDVPNGAWVNGSNTSLETLVNNMKGATMVIYYLPNDTDRQYGLDNSNWGVCACTTLGDNSFIEWTSLDGGKRYYKFKCTGTWNGSWYPTSAFNTPANNGVIESAKLVSYEDGCKNNQAFLYSKNQTSGLPKGAEFGFRFVHTFTDGNHTSTGKPNAMIVLFDMNGCIYMNTIQTGDWLGWRQFSSVAVEDA